jgi:hypothetical protein
MLRSITEKVTVKRGGLVELRRPELIEGTLAEVIVVVETASTDDTYDDDGRVLRLEKMGVLSQSSAALDPTFVDRLPILPIDCKSPLAALLEERENGR